MFSSLNVVETHTYVVDRRNYWSRSQQYNSSYQRYYAAVNLFICSCVELAPIVIMRLNSGQRLPGLNILSVSSTSSCVIAHQFAIGILQSSVSQGVGGAEKEVGGAKVSHH